MLSPREGLLGHLAKAALLAIVLSNRPLLIPPEQALGSKMISLIMSLGSESSSCSVTELCQGQPGPGI